MSHFTVYVFTNRDGKTVEDLLAPYDENIECAPYIQYTKAQAIVHVREDIEDYKHSSYYIEFMADPESYREKHKDHPDHLNYLENVYPNKLKWSDEQCYESMRDYYDDDMVDEEGNLYSTYNPNSKWDWYEVGGRWHGGLVTKEGNTTNKGYVSEIDWEKTGTPFAFITPNGRWHEKGEMGWWAIVSNEKEEDNWETEFKNELNKLMSDDLCVTLVDCHI